MTVKLPYMQMNLPKCWQAVEFGSVLDGGTRNGIYKSKKFRGSGNKMVNMGELFAYPRLRDVPMSRIQLTKSEKERFSLHVGDLLFARRSLTAEGAGKCSIVCEVKEPLTFESSIIRARPNPKIADSLYLYYLFNSPIGKYLLGTILRQVAVAGITGTDLVQLKIPLPLLSEQHAIAEVLGTLDDKIEQNHQMNQTLESLARAIFKSWFVDFDPVRAKMDGIQPKGMDAETAALFPDEFEESVLGKIPKGWKVVPLPEAIEVNPSRTLKKGEVAPYLEMANMPTKGHRGIDWIDRAYGSGTRFKNGDTLLARITPCLENGKTAFVDFLSDGQVGWGSTEYIVLHPKPPLPIEYGYYLARSDDLRNHTILNMTGTSGRQRAPASCFDNYLIVLPPEQIAMRFGKLAKTFMAKIRANDEQSRTLAALRDTLLPRLMSGEVRVKDV